MRMYSHKKTARPQPDLRGIEGFLSYSPDTGAFVWAKSPAMPVKVGQAAGTLDGRGYLQIKYRGRPILAHRLAWFYVHKEWPAFDIDHINLDRTDNRIANLRIANRSQNVCNRPLRSNNRSGLKGVYWHKRKKRWHADIRVDGKKTCLGYFDTPEAAHSAYRAAAVRLHGEFARFE